ncbi:MAG: benzoate-CoA ligase family protein [Gammaproteobacteria bacterium]
MQDHTVEVDLSGSEPKFRYAENFNVAVPFIDRHLAEGRSDKVVIRTAKGDSVTYRQLAENVGRCGNVLKGLDLSHGDRVLMVVKDCPEFFYLFWGAIKAGFVPVPLNTLLRSSDYQYMIEDSGCSALFYSPEFAGEVEPALAAARTRPEHAICTEGDGSLQERLAKADTALDPHPAKATDECFWLYSSGSTGKPKGAVHRHRDMVVTGVCYAQQTLGMREEDTCFSAAKLFFAYGLGNAMSMPLWVGASAILFDGRPTPETTFEVIEKFKPTLYFGVPTLYAAQLQSLETTPRDLSSIRWCVSAGEALPPHLFEKWKEKTGTTILDGIGSTEALHIFISNRPEKALPGTSGQLVTGYQAKIIDEEGNPVPTGEAGQLFIKGDSTAAYYWNNPEKTATTMVDGWLNTGDTYRCDEEGLFYYEGRSDDMMKVGGIWCSPFEIEATLAEHPAVLEAAVVGREDDDTLIKPEAYLVLKDPSQAGDALTEELIAHCKGKLAKYKYPRWFNYVDELPKTATGKIQRFKLRQS